MTEKQKTSKLICEAALALAGERGWTPLSLRDIADRAELGLAEVYEITSSKLAVLIAIEQHLSALLSGSVEAFDDEDTPRDRVFDVVMVSLEELEPYRHGVEAIYRALLKDPVSLVFLYRSFRHAMTAISEAAGLETEGLKGRLTIDGMSVIWLNTFRVWLEDDGVELAKTMAELDKSLRRLEGLVDAMPDCRLPFVNNLPGGAFSR